MRWVKQCILLPCKNPVVLLQAGVNTASGPSEDEDEDAGSFGSPLCCRLWTTPNESKGLSRWQDGGESAGTGDVCKGSGGGGKGQRSTYSSTLTGIDISVDLYIDMQVIFSLFEVIYNNYITQRIQFQLDKIASIQYSILLLLFMIT